MKSRLETALQLNNEGVSLLLQNEDVAAVHHLTEALTMVKQALGLLQQPCTIGLEEESSESLVVVLLPSEEEEELRMVHDSIYTIPDFTSNDDCFIYNGAIVFSSSSSSTTTTPIRSQEQDLNVYSACIILNIAMIYHRQGLLCGNKRRVCLEKADLMYDMVLRLLLGDNEGGGGGGGTALLVQLASLNNRSLIRLEQGDYDFSRSSFYLLTRILTSTRDEQQVQELFQSGDVTNTNIARNHHHHHHHHYQDGGEAVQGMLLNALLANTPTTAAAA
jgi:hypothetical protein